VIIHFLPKSSPGYGKRWVNQPGLLWQVVAFERTSGGAH
jgi:hypothetical protein